MMRMITWLKTVFSLIDGGDVVLLFKDGRVVVGVGHRDPQIDDRLLALAVAVGG